MDLVADVGQTTLVRIHFLDKALEILVRLIDSVFDLTQNLAHRQMLVGCPAMAVGLDDIIAARCECLRIFARLMNSLFDRSIRGWLAPFLANLCLLLRVSGSQRCDVDLQIAEPLFRDANQVLRSILIVAALGFG